MANKYRKKPVVIEARQWLPEDLQAAGEIAAWLHMGNSQFKVLPNKNLAISTLEGEMIASVGDWIIRGVQGEFYPCREDIFEATYEAVLTAEEKQRVGDEMDGRALARYDKQQALTGQQGN